MRKNFDLSAIRERLAAGNGKQYWRSLEEVAETDEFQELLTQEFPQGIDQWLNPVSRRNFLKLMAASLALGGMTACAPKPAGKIVPYVNQPENAVPSQPYYYATAFQLGGVATGVLAESHLGRPTKIEGNPLHPGSLGATDAFAQAEILSLYDPDRSQNPAKGGIKDEWANVLAAFQSIGRNIRVLSQTTSSPTLIDLMDQFLQANPGAKWLQYEPVNNDGASEGAKIAFGQAVNPVYHFEEAAVILSLEADFLAAGPVGVRYARDFSQKRKVREDKTDMNRLYMAESSVSVTGGMADHRVTLKPSQMAALAQTIAHDVGIGVDAGEHVDGVDEAWLHAVVDDLKHHEGHSLVIAGESQSPAIHALAYAMNDALGNVGKTVTYTEPIFAGETGQLAGLRELADEMAAGQVDALLIIDANPVYNAPADLKFADLLANIPFSARLGLYEDETSAACQWHLPASHFLEAWGDGRAFDGTVSLIQPIIEPLYNTKSAIQLLNWLMDPESEATDFDLVSGYWASEISGDFGKTWREAVMNGFFADTALDTVSVSADEGAVAKALADASHGGSGLEIAFRPDPTVWDGRFANNGWMQELPKPFTKLTWDNAAYVSPATAESLGVINEDVVDLDLNGVIVRAPVMIVPGHAADTVTLSMGYGRTRAGRVGNNVGANAFSLLSSESPWYSSGLNVRKTGESYRLATTQIHFNMEGRHLVRAGSIDHFIEDPEFIQHMVHLPPDISLMPEWEYDTYAWGMVVDLNACTGCNACVVACQSENNIAVVGKEQVLVGREMQWIRVDNYFEGELDAPESLHQPVMCQHCEQAPCELVCPVNATMHDSEGLNVMVYNRCIGTRYCANNCPYKVRRYNFLEFGDSTTESLKLGRNPNVTVRNRGVMEKCSFCVQRIAAARITAKKEGREIRDGEVRTACQAVCPTEAITFGDLNDQTSEVAHLKAQPHNYGLLTELGTRPRTTYLGKLRNPSPMLASDEGQDDGGHH